jgi:hypothetical protein
MGHFHPHHEVTAKRHGLPDAAWRYGDGRPATTLAQRQTLRRTIVNYRILAGFVVLAVVNTTPAIAAPGCAYLSQVWVGIVEKGQALGCTFANEDSWNKPRSDLERACSDRRSTFDLNYAAVKRHLSTCQGSADAGKPKGDLVAVASNTVYKKPNGDDSAANVVCKMRAGDTAYRLKKGPDKWISLSVATGKCAKYGGWVWNEGELKSK